MSIIDKRILDFILEHHVFSLATSKKNKPYSASCYYVYDRIENALIFSSDEKTKHAQQFIENHTVSATIAIETDDFTKIKGLQLLGEVSLIESNKLKRSTELYLDRFPFAKELPINLWILKLTYIKMTDNSLGFGKKLIWN